MFLLQFLIFLLTIYILKRWFYTRKWDHFPGFTSYSSLPVIGHAYRLNTDKPNEQINELYKRYGPIFRMDLGAMPSVIISDYDLLTSALKTEAFSGRVITHAVEDVQGLDDFGHVAGLASSSGQAWKEQRRFMQSQFGDLGVRKADKLTFIIGEEAEKMSDYLLKVVKGKENGIVDLARFFLPVANNVTWRLLTGKSTNLDDPEIQSLTKDVARMFEIGSPANKLFSIQFNSYSFYKLCQWIGIETLPDIMKGIKRAIKDEVDKYSANSEGNYIERNLAEIDMRKDDPNHINHDSRGHLHMHGTLTDIFVAGTDTTATIIEWCLLYLAQYPQCQDKLFQELKDHVGLETSISIEDKNNMPYTVAFIDEVLRFCPLGSSISLAHKTLEDTHLGGYFFPKGTAVFPYLTPISRGEKYFEAANEFKPERFLDPSTGEYKPNKHVVTFLVGKRRCAGEQLARAEAFMFLTALVKKFEFKPPKEGMNMCFEYNIGIVPYPKYATLKVLCR